MQDTTITINIGDANGPRQLTYTEVQQLIGKFLNSANFSMAASVSMQLAAQLPQDSWPHLVAAESLYLHQQIEPAFRYINRALEIDPHSIAGLVIKSRLYVYTGNPEQAVKTIDAAISLTPKDAKLHSVKAELLADTGDIDSARDSYLKSIQINPRNTSGLLGLSQLSGDNYSDELIKKVELIIQTRQLPPEEQMKAHFALAYAYDKKGKAANHFAHLRAGNDIKDQSLTYDQKAARQETQGIIEFFSKEFFARQEKREGDPGNIIFIVGFPRCGSTLVEQILSSHPSVSGAGEIFALRHAIRDFQQLNNLSTGYPHWTNKLPAEALKAIADDYLQKVQPFNQSAFMTDKLLDNYIFIGMIHLIFPNAKIINVQRNPIDVCYSCFKHLFNLSSVPFTYNLENLASKYRDYHKAIQHWHKVLPGKIYTVEYEQLVNNQEKVTRDLLVHCELPWDEACMNFHQNSRTVQTNSNIQVRQPLYANAIDRWKNYEEHLGPLLDLTND